MKVLEFAFDSRDTGSANDYLPHNYTENCVAYTGTHDNETIIGWLDCITKEEKAMVREYLCDQKTAQKELNWPMIALVMRSRANLSVIPMQDYLGLDNRARINQPSTVGKNWKWRVQKEQLNEELQGKIRKLTRMYGRINWQWDHKLDAQ